MGDQQIKHRYILLPINGAIMLFTKHFLKSSPRVPKMFQVFFGIIDDFKIGDGDHILM